MIERTPEISLQPSTDQAFKLLVEKEGIAALSDRTYIIDYLDDEEECNWKLIPETLFMSTFGVGLPKNSPYTDIFSKR